MMDLMPYIIGQLTNCGIFIVLALGLHLINGVCGQLSLGHAGFWAVGAYAGAAYSVFLAPAFFPDVVNFSISCLIGFSSAALAGLAIGVPCLRLRGDYLAIATLGFGEIIRIILINMDIVGGPRGFSNIPKWTNLIYVFICVMICTIVVINLLRGTHGRAIISIRENEIAAENMGIPLFKYKTLAFVIGAGMAGLAGPLLAHHMQYLNPNGFTFMQSVIILLMIILGGLGSTRGAIIGATILTLLPEILRFLGNGISEWRMVIYSVLLIILMLVRPNGIMGVRK